MAGSSQLLNLVKFRQQRIIQEINKVKSQLLRGLKIISESIFI
jgi:hypothetical protein